MGDIQTHSKITRAVANLFPTEHRARFENYFHFGNYLTDVSQFRDPAAFIAAKSSIWDRKRHGSLATFLVPHALDWLGHLDQYLDELMGTPDRPGKLGEWFRLVNKCLGVDEFARSHGPDHPAHLTPPEFERLFDNFWTQYWPHEHVDFPPWPFLDPIGQRVPSAVTTHDCQSGAAGGSGQRRVMAYTEEQLFYLAEVLTAIEQEWRRLGIAYDTDSKLRELHGLLVRFGRACHAVEDFFFHSNFVEISWDELEGMSGLPEPSERERLFGAADTRNRRRFGRRLRSPAADGERLSTVTSTSSNLVYTGFFAGKDVFHTFADALKGFEPKMQVLAKALSSSHFQEMAEPAGRVRLREAAAMERHCAQHRTWLAEKKYEADAQNAVNLGLLSSTASSYWNQAWDLDRGVFLNPKYDRIQMGIYGFTASMLVESELEKENSDARVDTLDQLGLASEALEPSDNGASGEIIGSHSLMSKDSERKAPLRVAAENLAIFVCRYVVHTMMTQVGHAPAIPAASFDPDRRGAPASGDSTIVDRLRGVDWLDLLRHFVCHPVECIGRWHIPAMLANVTEEGAGLAFPYHHIIDEATEDGNRGASPRFQNELEQKYRDMETAGERHWRSRLRADGAADDVQLGTMIAGAALGAVAGAFIGNVVGGPVGAVIGAVLGLVAGAVVGSVLGAGLGALVGSLL